MVNRRSFLRNALAGSTVLATSHAMALPTDRPETFDETYDVIVVGAGARVLPQPHMQPKKASRS